MNEPGANNVVRSRPVVLERGISLQDALGVVFGACFAHWSGNIPALLESDGVAALKQMRVGLRRFRSALATFKPVLDAEEAAGLNDALREILRVLGNVRDRDVFLEQIAESTMVQACDPKDVVVLERILRRQRDTMLHQARTFVRSERFAATVGDVEHWIAEKDHAGGLPMLTALWHRRRVDEFATGALTKCHKRLMKRGRGFEALDIPHRHDVRVAIKKLRYPVEFFASLYPEEPRETFRQTLRELQDDLGHLNDIAVAQDLLAAALADARRESDRLAVIRLSGFVSGWYAHKIEGLEPQMVADWKRFAALPRYWLDEKR